MKFANEKVLTDEDMSADFVSDPILIDQIFGYSFQAIFSGSPDGSFKLQASNDDVSRPQNVSNWTDIAGTALVITVDGDAMWNVTNAFYKWVRISWTVLSGTGSCSVTYASKG
jgi:hypothetical protein